MFTLDFIPIGTYTLSLSAVMDVNEGTMTQGALTFVTEQAEKHYLPLELEVVVDQGDLSLPPLEVKVKTKNATAAR